MADFQLCLSEAPGMQSLKAAFNVLDWGQISDHRTGCATAVAPPDDNLSRRSYPDRLSPLLIVLCLLFPPGNEAFAEPSPLSAADIRERLIGNTLVFHHRGQPLAKRYLAEDGTADFDPLRGFRVPSHWVLDQETDRLCFWDIDPENTYCGHFLLDEERYLIDWGNGFNRDFHEALEAGDTTDPSDNPGPDFKPHPDIAFAGESEHSTAGPECTGSRRRLRRAPGLVVSSGETT